MNSSRIFVQPLLVENLASYFFLGIDFKYQCDTLILSQERYISDILAKYKFDKARWAKIHMIQSLKLTKDMRESRRYNYIQEYGGILAILKSYKAKHLFSSESSLSIST